MRAFLSRAWCLRLAGAGLVLALTAGAAQADFPTKPVRIVVPFAPGGGTDLIARTLGQEMAKDLGQPVIIDNKPGAGTIIGTDAVAKAAPDGYTLVMASFAHAVNPSLQSKLPFDNANAFAPVMLVGRGPNVLVVRPASPLKTVQDVLSAARANPGKLTYASQGAGTSAHLAGEMFDNLAKVKTLHVPYRGAGPAMTDLMGGQVEMFFGTAAAVAPFVDRGQLRAIAVTSAEPSAAFKGIPTIGASIAGYGGKLVWLVRAGRHAEGRDLSLERRRPQGGPFAGVRAQGRGRGPCHRRGRTRRTRHLRARRGGPLGPHRQGKRHQGRLNPPISDRPP
ncbi:hypothetical protein GCM10007320_29910 [Pseudorhodoferax aquiterrae]|uniref:Tripartite-type tricarboxylate transporter receptor subunit TctC n=1 Tax=Pseudorhodoferax aquiterrae TaxID=747304 RepID=A0ABQ3G474_9BURK|nr:hypothetical protein GCM10007320_29910 [Pseudorhodoferax aquiterrae]